MIAPNELRLTYALEKPTPTSGYSKKSTESHRLIAKIGNRILEIC